MYKMCKVEVLESKQIEFDGKLFLSNSYQLQKENQHVFEKQMFTYVDDRYLLFHLSDIEQIEERQITELFKAIKFDCL